MNALSRFALAAPFLALSNTCSLTTSPDEVVPGALIRENSASLHADTASIEVPGSVASGERFRLVVHTLEGGCVRRPRRAVVSVTGNQVEMSTYNRRTRSSRRICPDDLLTIRHAAEIRIHAPGTATIRIHGRVDSADSRTAWRPATLVRTVEVH